MSNETFQVYRGATLPKHGTCHVIIAAYLSEDRSVVCSERFIMFGNVLDQVEFVAFDYSADVDRDTVRECQFRAAQEWIELRVIAEKVFELLPYQLEPIAAPAALLLLAMDDNRAFQLEAIEDKTQCPLLATAIEEAKATARTKPRSIRVL